MCGKPEEVLQEYVKVLKVAVAVAVIRQTPASLTPQAFAAQLCGRYQRWQLGCRQRAQLLQEEVLSLKQQLHLANVRSTTGTGSHLAAATQEPDDTPSQSDSHHATLFPTPPCSSEFVEHSQSSVEPVSANGDVTLRQHVTFLRSVASLRQTSRIKNPGGELRSILKDTIVSALGDVGTCLCSSEFETASGLPLANHAVSAIVDLLDSDVIVSDDDVILERSAQVLQGLLGCILNDAVLNNRSRQEERRKLVMKFGRSRRLRCGVLRLLTRTIRSYSDTLRDTTRVKVNPHEHENIYYILSALDTLLREALMARKSADVKCTSGKSSVDASAAEEDKAKSRGNVSNKVVPMPISTNQSKAMDDKVNWFQELPLEVVDYLREEMEKSLLHISDMYPMFAQYIWRIGAVIDR